MLISASNYMEEERGSRLGFIIVLLLGISLVAFMLYFFASVSD